MIYDSTLQLIHKYNLPVPRYTSYPTVPFWKQELAETEWEEDFQRSFDEQNPINGISIYIHLPFCESLCTYCGCNKKITTNHKVESEYLLAIEKEWMLYRRLMKKTPIIRGLHLGGGTPTFFSPENLQRLIGGILKSSIIHPHHDFSFEGHPNNTTYAHLQTLFELGFRRVSFGVQDNDPAVQHIINRIQPLENVKRAIENARTIGYQSVNFDLIYGLPLQTLESIERTIKEIIQLKPDRIAFYSYAHVPWTSKGQRLFDEKDLPSPEEKIQLYIKGKELLIDHGYSDIGMDHFALPSDTLYEAWKRGKLHRNFMGYTTQDSELLLGLGVSSISDTGTCYAQNDKTLHDYYERINKGELAIKKGHHLSKEDQTFKKYIKDIICKGETTFNDTDQILLRLYTFPKLEELARDGLIDFNEKGLRLIGEGRYFVRNVCSAFDLYLQRSQEKEQINVFSKAI